ncbi:MAG TPA: ankyrin repeat domain-containing protein [Gammaproteobacteria bacterium]|nr:ankyrin repeat domain-containing protein [Gammaproteobacteria bacterium]
MLEKAKAAVAQVKAKVWNPKQSPLLFLELADAVFSIPFLDAHVNGNGGNLDAFFSQRWDLIANGPLCYTHNPEYPLNVVCDNLAVRKKSRLMPGVYPLDVVWKALDKTKWGTFFISDNRKNFIRLKVLAETAFNNIRNSEVVIYVDNHNLTEAELKRTGKVYEILEEMRRISDTGEQPGGLYTEIIALRDGLEKGNAEHKGTSNDAGGPAALAVLRFFTYFDVLPETKKNEIRALKGNSETFGETLDKLRRSMGSAKKERGDSLDVKYCVTTLGGYVSGVIKKNNAFLRSFKSNPAARLAALRDSVEHVIRVGKPLSSPHIFTLPLDKQIQTFNGVINQNLSGRKDECTELLFSLIQFIVSECQRKMLSRDYDEKLNCYINLLLAVGFETTDFCQRPRLDNLFVIKEIIARLSVLTNCRAGYFDRYHQPKAKSRWGDWLSHNKLLPVFFDVPAIPKKSTALTVYTTQYPLPRTIMSGELAKLREGYTVEPVVVAEVAVRQQPGWGFSGQNVVELDSSKVADELRKLASDQTLKEITLKSNITTIDEALAFTQLFRALETNKTVTTLCLHGLKLYPAMVYQLQELLEKNTTLKVLNLQGCFLASEVRARYRRFFYDSNQLPYTLSALLLPSLKRNHSLRRYIPPAVLAQQLVITTGEVEQADLVAVNAVNDSLRADFRAEDESMQDVIIRNLSEIYTAKIKKAMAENDFKRVMHLRGKNRTDIKIDISELLCVAVRDKNCDQNLEYIRRHFSQEAADHDGSPLLHLAHTVTVARCLYECGANIYAQDSSNKTALFNARVLNKHGIVKFLEVCIKEQNSRFFDRVCADDIEEVKRLVELGQNPDFKVVSGRTPLHYARSPEVVVFLLEQGLAIDAQDDEKKTPLHCTHKVEVVRCLIEKGADVLARDAQGKIPEDYPGTEELLLKARLSVIDKIHACFSSASSTVAEMSKGLTRLVRFNESEIVNVLKQKDAQGFSVLSTIQCKLKKKLQLPVCQKIITPQIEAEFEQCYLESDLPRIIELIHLGIDLSEHLVLVQGILLMIINNYTPAAHQLMHFLIKRYLEDLDPRRIADFLRLKNDAGFSLLYFMERPSTKYSSNINCAKRVIRDERRFYRVDIHDLAAVEQCVKSGIELDFLARYHSNFAAYAKSNCSDYNFLSLRYFMEHGIVIDNPSLELFVAAAKKGEGAGAKEFLRFIAAQEKSDGQLMAKRANQSSGSVLQAATAATQTSNNGSSAAVAKRAL